MNHSEIIQILADRTGRTQKDVKQAVSKIVKSLGAILGEKTGYTIPELGTFGTHVREERKAYSIPDARNMIIPPKRLVFFGPASDLKENFKDASTVIASTAPKKVKKELNEHEKMRLEMSADLHAAEEAQDQADEAALAEAAKETEAAEKMDAVIQAEDAADLIDDDITAETEDAIKPDKPAADDETEPLE